MNDSLRGRRAVVLCAFALSVFVAGCDERFNPTAGRIRLPAVSAPTGTFALRMVDDKPLPHATLGNGTIYTIVEGGIEINADSTWAYHSTTIITDPAGTINFTSKGNYGGKWTVTDSTINLLSPATGTIRIKGDSLVWTGPPKQPWEEVLKFTLSK